MKVLTNLFHSQIVFWMAWIIIPIIMEIVPAVVDFFILIQKRRKKKQVEELEYFPYISLIVPIYNSADTLYECIESIYQSHYEPNLIDVICVDNGSVDQSFQIFCRCQQEFPDMRMQWISAKQGKSKALNLALFNSDGKYIIHIDSDGLLHKEAIYNIVTMFETNSNADCVTGTVLTNPDLIKNTRNPWKRIFQETEFYEYCQAFLAGRNFQSEFNAIFTLSGAFSAFRKSTIMETNLYNTDTVCEDTHITFQVRRKLNKKVLLCDDAYFFVDPIEDMGHLYTQRQRWQRGELEVVHMFASQDIHAVRGYFSDFVVRLLMYDHTFAFPRMIWYFALLCLAMMKYPIQLIIDSLVIQYTMYVISGFLFYLNIVSFLQNNQELRKYYSRHFYQIFLLPLFNFVVFWFRFAGIINSIQTEQHWRTRNLKEERNVVYQIIDHDFLLLRKIIQNIRKLIERKEE